MERRLRALTRKLFNSTCVRENLLFKLEQVNNKMADLECVIRQYVNYPNEPVIYESEQYALRITPLDIAVYTHEQFEREKEYNNDEEFR